MPGPVVVDGHAPPTPRSATVDTCTLRIGVLQRVLDEVGGHLAEPIVVGATINGDGHGWTTSARSRSAASGSKPSHGDDRQLTRSTRLGAQRERRRLQLGQVEQVGDQSFEAASLAT